ncbi:MAG TPA: hypothetical protein VIE91_00880 [Methylophilaceae bacterium]|jgi:hypothetical protein
MTVALFVALCIFVILTFNQYGISNDEEVQHTYGRLLLKFYTSGFVDQDAFKYLNLYLYGGFFDLIAAILERVLPTLIGPLVTGSILSGSIGIAPVTDPIFTSTTWVWDMRHLLSALFGLFGIYGAYKAARMLGGERVGFFVIALLAITGSWSGAMFTHTKDVPFGTCMIWALYYTMRISQRLPRPSLGLSIKFGIAVGCAIGMRIGGVFAVFYLFLMLILAGWVLKDNWRTRWKFWFDAFKAMLPGALVAFVLMAIFWPWGVMSPEHPLQAAAAFSHFTFDMLTVMDGEVMQIGAVPREYLPAYLLVRLPEVFLLGLLSMVACAVWYLRDATFLRGLKRDSRKLLIWFTLTVAALFPLVFIMLDKPALYNGVRHFTFILPPLAIVSALGLNATWEAMAKMPKIRVGFVLIAVLSGFNTAYTLYGLHPYEYVYYNHLAGNMADAEKEWEGDYWSSSLREAAELLESQIPKDEVDGDGLNHAPYRVAVCAESIQGEAYLDHRFQITSDWLNADFFISSTNMNCDKVLQGRIIGTVNRLGAVLAVVKDRRQLLEHERMPRPAPH